MPTYEYRCPTCPQTINVSRAITDPEHVPVCFGCSRPMDRVFTAPGVSFKGSGFNYNEAKF